MTIMIMVWQACGTDLADPHVCVSVCLADVGDAVGDRDPECDGRSPAGKTTRGVLVCGRICIVILVPLVKRQATSGNVGARE